VNQNSIETAKENYHESEFGKTNERYMGDDQDQQHNPE